MVSVGCATKLRRLAVPATLVRLNRASDDAPAAVAVTWKVPTCGLAAMAGEAAMPLLSVFTVAHPENVTLAPLPGGVKVTANPLSTLPKGSCTCACNGAGYG